MLCIGCFLQPGTGRCPVDWCRNKNVCTVGAFSGCSIFLDNCYLFGSHDLPSIKVMIIKLAYYGSREEEKGCFETASGNTGR